LFFSFISGINNFEEHYNFQACLIMRLLLETESPPNNVFE